MRLLPPNGIWNVVDFTQKSIAEGEMKRAEEGRDTKRLDFFSKTLELHEEDPVKFPRAAIMTLCITNFGAGSDTTSISLCALLFNLLSNPDVLRKASHKPSSLPVKVQLV